MRGSHFLIVSLNKKQCHVINLALCPDMFSVKPLKK